MLKESLHLHHCHSVDGALLATLRESHLPSGSSRFEFLDESGRLLLTTVVRGPGATEVLVGANGASPFARSECAQTYAVAPNAEIQQVGDSTVLQSFDVKGHTLRVIDDYGRRTRHFIFGCGPGLFLHVNLDEDGTITLMEKDIEYSTLRVVRRDQAGHLLEDTATMQPGERLEHIARRCGMPLAVLTALNPLASVGTPAPGATLRLA